MLLVIITTISTMTCIYTITTNLQVGRENLEQPQRGPLIALVVAGRERAVQDLRVDQKGSRGAQAPAAAP